MGKKSREKKERASGALVPWETRFKYRPDSGILELASPPPIDTSTSKVEDEPDPEAKRLVLLLAALEGGVEAGLFDLDPRETMRKAGLDVEKAESARPALLRFMEESGAFEGRNRPRKPPERVLSRDTVLNAGMAVRDYIMEHAWCVDTSGPRAYYSKEFKDFITALLGPGGMAAGATLPEAVEITGVPAQTLSVWLRQTRRRATAPVSPDNLQDK